MSKYIDIVFDGPPSSETGRFVEVENDQGASIKLGEWVDRGDGYWALRVNQTIISPEAVSAGAMAVGDYSKKVGLLYASTSDMIAAALEAAVPILQAQAKADELQLAYESGIADGSFTAYEEGFAKGYDDASDDIGAWSSVVDHAADGGEVPDTGNPYKGAELEGEA